MSRKNNDDAALGCVVQALLIVFLLPIVGLCFVAKKDVDAFVLKDVADVKIPNLCIFS